MANSIQVEKPRLVTARFNGPANANNDPVFAAYLARIGQGFSKLNGVRSILTVNQTKGRLNRCTVAKTDGLWLSFNPEKEEVQKTRQDEPIGKFIVVDIPKGMWSVGEGKMLVGMAPIMAEMHVDIVADLMYIIAAERNADPKEIFLPPNAEYFSFGSEAKVIVNGGGAIEYQYRPNGQALTIFIDPGLPSLNLHSVQQNVLAEIIARVNGCEGVRIEHRCL